MLNTFIIRNYLRITDPYIQHRRMTYPPERGDYETWLHNLISLKCKREHILKQIETNINSEKLRKLPRYNLIP